MSHDHNHSHLHGECPGAHCHHHHGDNEGKGLIHRYREEIVSLLLLLSGTALTHAGMLSGIWALCWYVAAILPVGAGIAVSTVREWMRGDVFNEFTLMMLACLGAFAIGEYPEAVAVLLFYSLGEKLEDSASRQARKRISSLLATMPDEVRMADGTSRRPGEVQPGEQITVRPGERVPLDCRLDSDTEAAFDTSALTGESVPRSAAAGGEVAAGWIPADREVRLTVLRPASESAMSRIMKMIERAAARKSNVETTLRSITRWYTPAVMALALLLFLIPWVMALCSGAAFDWQMWLRRSLVLLVCSCPCALVVSVPLSYFAALGSASRRGMLFKGSRWLDVLRHADTLLLDKTGTLTTGEFRVVEVAAADGHESGDILRLAAALDAHSTHPLARAICKAADNVPEAEGVKTVPHGMEGIVWGETVLVGSPLLLRSRGVGVPHADGGNSGSEVCVALGGRYAGTITLADTMRPGVAPALRRLRDMGIRNIEILSGDRPAAVERVAAEAGADGWHAEMTPEGKYQRVETLIKEGRRVAFVGDGINDAPSLALADLGIAVGDGGTDVAMESADAVINGKGIDALADTMSLARRLHATVAANITLAIGVKAIVMALGAFGIATLWAAVFADTGITLLTVLITMTALRK